MWLDTLVEMKRMSSKTLKQIAVESDIPLGTLNKIFSGQTADPKYETIKAIVHCLGFTLDELNADKEKRPSLTGEALMLARDFDTLDIYGQQAVRAVADAEIARIKGNAAPAPATKVIPFVLQSMAAGAGEPDYGNIDLDTYEVPADSKAEFACRVHGDSLEPYYNDQDVALAVKRQPAIGEVGVFLVDGEYIIKQYVDDGIGNVYLFAVNRDRSDTDRTLWASEEHSVYCLGTVIMKRVPLPEV